MTERRRAAEAGRRLADQLGAPPLRGLAQRGMAAVHLIEGDYEDAVAAMLDQVDLLEQGGRDRDRALAHTIASLFVADIRGDYEQALAHARSSYAVARELFPHDRMHGTFFVMACLEQLGRWSEIEPYLDEHLQLLDGPEAGASCPYIRGGPLVGALALARLGDVRRARELAAADAREPRPPRAGRGGTRRSSRSSSATPAPAGSSPSGWCASGAGRRRRRSRTRRSPSSRPSRRRATTTRCSRFLPTARAASGYLAVLTPTCDRAEGLARAAAGDARAAEALLTRAVAGFDRMSLPLQAARSRERLAAGASRPRRRAPPRGASLVREVGRQAGRGARGVRARRGVAGGDQLQLALIAELMLLPLNQVRVPAVAGDPVDHVEQRWWPGPGRGVPVGTCGEHAGSAFRLLRGPCRLIRRCSRSSAGPGTAKAEPHAVVSRLLMREQSGSQGA